MALALNNLKRVDMPLNKETKPNQTKPAPGQSGPGRDGNEEELRIPQSPNITGTLPSDYLMPYPGHLVGGGLTPLQKCSQHILQT